MSVNWEPDIVIGIDFGMTCTGVAWSAGPQWAEPKCIQKWPRKLNTASELANKVPSQVSYDHNGTLQTWGFLCEGEEEQSDLKAWFKLYINPEFTDRYPNAPNHGEARQYFRDYLSLLHGYVEQFFSQTQPRWNTMKVEYLFSIPTNWRNPNLSAEIKAIAMTSGFGRDEPRCQVKISLTEAEAAAVCAATNHFQRNDVIIVVDAGGGTTDVNVLKVTAATSATTTLSSLSVAEGVNAGSALIDMEMQKVIEERLRAIPDFENLHDLRNIAQNMLKADFRHFKHDFGNDGADLPTLRLPVPALQGRSFANLEILRGAMIIRIEVLRSIFDRQIEAMTTEINKQLRDLERNRPTEHVSYMVISGGLGCSPYVQKRFKSKFETAPPITFNAQGIKLLYAPEPQLAVVQGLVMDRIQKISRGTGIYQDRCARVSYGVVCRELYDEKKHRGERVTQDPLDKTRWAEDQVDWFIKQGAKVPDNGISKPYQLKIPLDRVEEVWKAQIVMSHAIPDRLPRSLLHDDVRKVCVVEATFDTASIQAIRRKRGPGDEFKLKNNRFWQRGQQFILANFNVRVSIGAADLKFQLMSSSGETFSREHPEIEVVWEPLSSSSSGDQNIGKLFPKRE